MVTKYLPYATHKNLIEKRNEERKSYLTLSKKKKADCIRPAHKLHGKPFPDTIYMLGHIARSHRHLSVRQNLRKLHCRTHLLKWEPFPKPLVPKNPLKFIDVGIFFALRKKIMMITPLTKAINSRNE